MLLSKTMSCSACGVWLNMSLQVWCWLLGNIIFKDSGSCVGRAATM